MKTTTKKIAKPITAMLNKSLEVNANTASCCLLNQPKDPNGLSRFKKIK